MMFDFDPGSFVDVYAQPEGKRVVEWLRRPDNLVREEAATFLHRPAVEPLQPGLQEEFPDALRSNRFRQFVGFATKQIMENHGYELERPDVKIRFGTLFSVAARYKPRD